jgi:copper(I)-binding protein
VGRAEQKSRLAVVVALATGLGLAAAGCSAGQITQTDTQVAVVDGASGDVGAIAVRNAQFAFPVSGHEYKAGDEAAVVVTIANNATTADKLLSVSSDIGGPATLGGDVELEPNTSIASLFGELDRSSSARSTPSVTSTSTPSGSSSPSTSSSAGSSSTGNPSSGVPSGENPSSDPSEPSLTGSSTPSAASSSGRPSATASSSAAPGKPGKVEITVKLTKELRPGHTAKVTFLFEKAGPITLDVPIGFDPKPRPEGKSEH